MSDPATHEFRTTRWSLVLSSRSDAPEARRALDELVVAYWYPLYAYVRRTGLDDATARDRVQSFVVRLLQGGALDGADPSRGSFRAYLMAAVRHAVANERRDRAAIKRGGGRVVSLDDVEAGASLDDIEAGAATRYASGSRERTPDEEFERAWALEVTSRATERLRAEYESRDRAEVFAALADTLDGSSGARSHQERADDLGCSIGAVKVNAHRLRQRFAELVREEIRHTVEDEADVEDELRHLVTCLGAGIDRGNGANV